jgi:hypothetical protein
METRLQLLQYEVMRLAMLLSIYVNIVNVNVFMRPISAITRET